MIHLLKISAIALAMASMAGAQEILLIDKGGILASADPQSGDIAVIGWTGSGLLWDGLAKDSQGRLFSAHAPPLSPRAIYELDPQTGHATFVVQTNFVGVSDLVFGPGDLLYLMNARNAPSIGGPMDLHTINLTTGVTTFVGETGVTSITEMAFDGGVLWGFSNDFGLVQIDLNTGIATDISSNVVEPPFHFAEGLCASESGVLYFFTSDLWLFDGSTGVASRVGRALPYSDWSGAVFVEGTEPAFSLWYGGETNGPMEIKFSGATPGGVVALAWTTGLGGPTAIPTGFPCSGLLLDLNSNMRLLEIITAGPNGSAKFGPRFVPASAARSIRVQAIDLTNCMASNAATIGF